MRLKCGQKGLAFDNAGWINETVRVLHISRCNIRIPVHLIVTASISYFWCFSGQVCWIISASGNSLQSDFFFDGLESLGLLNYGMVKIGASKLREFWTLAAFKIYRLLKINLKDKPSQVLPS